ncbi:carbohydrate ABC transporter permease [Labrys wisconsinensis]|uniref:ABC-type sugar transport system permease subunit n=1 Tax=Labrys wisconsinensis TaxID=425677 RepID=A0ABU0J9D3_9HYPH|nr:sugar ABC transporter permease [Labrys wisconsinensis]MDQ0469874.1 ABC-type sugar transport system permease subunit [Labrys wisconsinensis]
MSDPTATPSEAEDRRPPLSAAERRVRRRTTLTALAFMAPAIVMVSVFLLYPVADNIWISLTGWAKFSGFNRFVGALNYRQALSNPNFYEATVNTVVWVVASLTLPILLGLAFAVLLRRVPGQGAFRSLFFIPRLLAPTAIGTIWYYVYADAGILNTVLHGVGLGGLARSWLYDPTWITPAMILAHVWQTTGLVMVLLLLGLAALPPDPIEAATVEGASPWQTFRLVVLPMLFPTLVVVTIISVIAGFTTFDLVWVMGRDYPNRSTLTLATHQYWESFRSSRWAYGAAVAVILGAIALLITWVQALLQQRLEERSR